MDTEDVEESLGNGLGANSGASSNNHQMADIRKESWYVNGEEFENQGQRIGYVKPGMNFQSETKSIKERGVNSSAKRGDKRSKDR